MPKLFVFFFLLVFTTIVNGQDIHHLADSIRIASDIPELAYAVVSADSVYEMKVLGVKKNNTNLAAALTDRFRLGSNTKAITGLIAALLVKQGKISWDTKFFEIFPEMKSGSRKEYYQLTLLDLLSFRTKLYRYTYTYRKPAKGMFGGDEDSQRYYFTKWFLRHAPEHSNDAVNFSNLGYVAAGLMLERASGKTYKQLVKELGDEIAISFEFGRPNATNSNQTWGHDARLAPETADNDYKLEWLLAAGNINCSLPDYIKFVQLQMKGLEGRSNLLSKEEFNFLHYGLPRFSVGWFSGMDDKYGPYSYNIGNPGTFLTHVYLYKDINRALILFANVQSNKAEQGMEYLLYQLKAVYCPKATIR